jgi:hypothetical protein
MSIKHFLHYPYTVLPLLVLLTSSMLSALPAAADDNLSFSQRFRFSAFGTLGIVYDDSPLHLQRDFGQPDTFRGGKYSWLADSLLGAQVDAKIVERLDATVQMVVKDRAEQSFEESLEWAFLRWKPYDELTLRAGRLGLDIYLLSDYRNVGYAYLWQRPVVEFYGPVMIQSFDGGDVSYRFKAGEGTIQAKLFGGVSNRSLELVRDGGVNSLEISSLFGGKLSYEDEQLRLSLGYVRATIGNNLKNVNDLRNPLLEVPAMLWPEAGRIAATIASKDRVFQFLSAGAAYDNNNWVLQGEIGYLASSWPNLPDILSGYLSIGYQIDDFTPYLILAAAKSQQGTPAVMTTPSPTGDPALDTQLAQLHGAAQQFMSGIKVDQKTVSVGMRWDFYQNMALKFQWDLSHVGANGIGLWWNQTAAPVMQNTWVNLLSSSINFTF